MKKKICLIACSIFLVALTVTTIYLVLNRKDQEMGNQRVEFEDNATMGIMPGVDLEARIKELQDQLDKGMIAFSINTSPVFANGLSEGNLMLENPGNNAKLLVAKVVLDDTKEVIYQSKYIKPGSYIENIKLDKVLESGTFPATVYFEAYTEDTFEFIGQTGAAILITVQG